ncbi:MAG TPA: glycogen debranching N-terminal domain-containing protein [Candidatus Limnocylindrales bacterium]|nr:glycogen debranching N-terminal domain-containing protein [Candidatus Limnocylindrales bacterium]
MSVRTTTRSTRSTTTRTIPAPAATIVPATDLGNVEVAKSANLYLLTDQRGDIRIDGRGLGLYDLDTRILSTSILRLNGSPLTLLRGPHQSDGADIIQLTNPELRRNPEDKRAAEPSLARRDLSLTRARHITGDLRELVTVVNYSATVEHLELELGLGVDMADIFEVRGYPRAARGTLRPIVLDGDRATFAYDGVDGRRRTTSVVADGATLEPIDDAETWPAATVLATWQLSLQPGARQTIGWHVAASVADEGAEAVARAPVDVPSKPSRVRPSESAGERPFDAPRIQSDHELLDRTVARSLTDLATLRNDGPADGEWYLAAGIPWFATLFGRDSLIASLETVAFMPSLARATLEVLARLQATRNDPWHDAEPGKIIHELRTGEMARAGETPHDAYYGSIDSTPLWLILLAETHAWTGDDAMLERLWPNALAALGWIEDSGDLDGDGFIEYQRRSKLGLLNQGWKDSGDSVRHLDGRPAVGPIALAEVQGYVFAAYRSMARLARHRRDLPLAERLDVAAGKLQARFEEAFWLPDVGFYAMALDGEKRPVASITSNPGQALWSGIVSAERAPVLAERLLAPDMFSGWGIRTFAAGQIGYNPVGYHTGSIWPHDNALIAAGLKASGAADSANLLAGRLIESAQWFPDLRLPELFCGFAREDVGAPVAYPVACSPQAWSAAAPFYLLHTMLGLRANATARRLELLRPTLPEWLGKLTITGLPVGDDSVDLLVHRWRGRTSAELLGRRGSIEVIIHV